MKKIAIISLAIFFAFASFALAQENVRAFGKHITALHNKTLQIGQADTTTWTYAEYYDWISCQYAFDVALSTDSCCVTVAVQGSVYEDSSVYVAIANIYTIDQLNDVANTLDSLTIPIDVEQIRFITTNDAGTDSADSVTCNVQILLKSKGHP